MDFEMCLKKGKACQQREFLRMESILMEQEKRLLPNRLLEVQQDIRQSVACHGLPLLDHPVWAACLAVSRCRNDLFGTPVKDHYRLRWGRSTF